MGVLWVSVEEVYLQVFIAGHVLSNHSQALERHSSSAGDYFFKTNWGGRVLLSPEAPLVYKLILPVYKYQRGNLNWSVRSLENLSVKEKELLAPVG